MTKADLIERIHKQKTLASVPKRAIAEVVDAAFNEIARCMRKDDRFAYPGFGRMFLDAALFQDIAVIEAGAMVAVVIAVMTQIVGDFGYMLLNPRIRFK